VDQSWACDVDGDGEITMDDMTRVFLRLIAP